MQDQVGYAAGVVLINRGCKDPNESTQVSKSAFAIAEKLAGFQREGDARPGELATSEFGSSRAKADLWVEGRIIHIEPDPRTYEAGPDFRGVVWPGLRGVLAHRLRRAGISGM